jgi:hypothetical protein
MASVWFIDVQVRPTEFLDLTSLTLDEFQQLVLPFEVAFHAHLAAWRLDGKPRTVRRFTVYKHCPLPPPGRAKPPSRLSPPRLAMPSLTRPLHGGGRCRSRPNASKRRWKHGVRKMSCSGCHPRSGILVL